MTKNTTRKALLTILLAAMLLLTPVFAACGNDTLDDGSGLPVSSDVPYIPSAPYIEPYEEGSADMSIPTESSEESEESDISEPSEASQPFEESETSEEGDTSEEGETSQPPYTEEKQPSTLTPILELGIGDGDYEVGYVVSDWAAPLLAGPEYFDVYENEILIGDSINKRLLLYSEGKLIDKVDVSEYHWEACTLDDDYYYLLHAYQNSLIKINRKTKKVSPIEIDMSDMYFVEFIRKDNDIYIELNVYGGDTVYLKIIGDKTEAVTDFKPAEIIEDKAAGTLTLKKGDKAVELKFGAIENASSMFLPVDIEGMYAKQRYLAVDQFYSAYFKIGESGECEGIYVSDSELQSLTGNFSERVDDNGNFVVVYKKDDKVVIYKVNFGFDAIPGR